ncbi:MAG: hypothetical protein JW838_00575 [Spirochaetes bacterium]|nr:hypothetical protein [Spirochaetota bacterium]
MKIRTRITGTIGSAAEGIYFIWGMLFAGWSPMLAAFGYWVEEAVVYLVTLTALIIMKIARGRRMFIPRYTFIYGFVLFVHTIFFLILAGITAKSDPAAEELFEAFFRIFVRGGLDCPRRIMTDLIIITAVVAAGTLYTVVLRILRSGPDPSVLVNRSFGAIIAPHFLLLFGIGGIMLTEAPSALVVVLIIVKVLVDLSGFADRGSPIVSPDET